MTAILSMGTQQLAKAKSDLKTALARLAAKRAELRNALDQAKEARA